MQKKISVLANCMVLMPCHGVPASTRTINSLVFRTNSGSCMHTAFKCSIVRTLQTLEERILWDILNDVIFFLPMDSLGLPSDVCITYVI